MLEGILFLILGISLGLSTAIMINFFTKVRKGTNRDKNQEGCKKSRKEKKL